LGATLVKAAHKYVGEIDLRQQCQAIREPTVFFMKKVNLSFFLSFVGSIGMYVERDFKDAYKEAKNDFRIKSYLG